MAGCQVTWAESGNLPRNATRSAQRDKAAAKGNWPRVSFRSVLFGYLGLVVRAGDTRGSLLLLVKFQDANLGEEQWQLG